MISGTRLGHLIDIFRKMKCVVTAAIINNPTSIRFASHKLRSSLCINHVEGCTDSFDLPRDDHELQLLSIVEADRKGVLRFCHPVSMPAFPESFVYLPHFEPVWLREDRRVLEAMECFSIESVIRLKLGRGIDTAAASSMKKVKHAHE